MRDYYVTMIRGKRTAWLAGPFRTHKEALAKVEAATTLAIKIDPWAHFDAFGTASLETGSGVVGVLNAKIGVDNPRVCG